MAKDLHAEDNALVERVRFAELFDVWSPILTEKQRGICEMLLKDDLSTTELAESLNVTRQGVHDLIRRTKAHLESLESLMHLKLLNDHADAIAEQVAKFKDELPQKFIAFYERASEELRRARCLNR